MKPDFTFIDLFAGIGGMRLGFEAAGGECVFTSEWTLTAIQHTERIFRRRTRDRRRYYKDSAGEIPDHDVLLAGFPCQPFSLAGVSKKNALGRPHGFECKTQGTLFFDVARIIACKRPRAFLLENVKNLLSHDRGNTFAVIRDVLENELGYSISARVIDGRHFVPQHRERILIVGFREPTKFDWDAIPFPDATARLRCVLHHEDGSEPDLDSGRYLNESGSVHEKYVLSDKLWNYLQAYAEKHRAKGMDSAAAFSARQMSRGRFPRGITKTDRRF